MVQQKGLTLPRFKNRWFSLVDVRYHERILCSLKRVVAQELSLSLQTTQSSQIALSRSKEDEFFNFGDQSDSQSIQTWVPMGDLEVTIFIYFFIYWLYLLLSLLVFLFSAPSLSRRSRLSALLLREISYNKKSFFFKFNTLIPSSAPVERLFSFATMINTAKSHRSSKSMFEKRVLLKARLNNENISKKE